MWNKAASVVGIVATVGVVWTRFVYLEARVEFSEEVMTELTGEIKSLSGHIQRLELQVARRDVCGVP